MSELHTLLKSANIETRESGTNVGREHINICCPYCQEERFHCGIHETDLWFKCFVCGEGGSWYKVKKKLRQNHPNIDWEQLSVPGAEHYLKEKVRNNNKPAEPIYWRAVSSKDGAIIEWLSAAPELKYLKEADRERGLNKDIAFDSGLMIGTGKLRGYIVFKNGDNILARKYTNEATGPRWWKRLSDSPYLFGADWVEKVKPTVGVITEGVFDCLRVPLGYGVAILGSTMSEDLVAKLVQVFDSADKLILALDKDANRNSVTQLRLMLADMGFEVILPDWNKITREGVKDLDELFLTAGEKQLFSFLQLTDLTRNSLCLI